MRSFSCDEDTNYLQFYLWPFFTFMHEISLCRELQVPCTVHHCFVNFIKEFGQLIRHILESIYHGICDVLIDLELQVGAGFLRRLVVLVGVVVGSLIFKAITPPPVNELNSLDGPKVTAPRMEMRDGRYLAYQEVGVKREDARHYIVHIHGYGGSRLLSIPIPKVSTTNFQCSCSAQVILY